MMDMGVSLESKSYTCVQLCLKTTETDLLFKSFLYTIIVPIDVQKVPVHLPKASGTSNGRVKFV